MGTRPFAGKELQGLDPELDKRWDALALASGAPVFLRPGWVRAWATAFGKTDAVRLLTVERGGELVAVMPLLAGALTLRSATNAETAVYAPVVADAEAAAELADTLLGLGAPSIDLAALSAADAGTDALVKGAERAGSALLRRTLRSSPYIDTSVGDAASFRAGLSKNKRHGLRRLEKRLAEVGELVLDVQDGRENRAALLAEGYRLEAREWKLAAGSAILSNPATTRFYDLAAEWAASEGLLRLAFLRVGGRAVGFGYLVEQAGTLSFLKLGMDDASAKLGPGIVIMHHLIDYAFADPAVTELDLLGENDAYKKDLASGTREQLRMQLFPNRRTGSAQRAAVVTAGELRTRIVEKLSDDTRDRLSAIRNRILR
ncbi:GNAT family N-acetyltransferase [Pseudonocardia ailaonensis]|uniref:GNAT family N-acetyltransferase n=1 Tax=Pseudonocardia ailaonensis TaxID=367279 RepID=UPI0031CEA53C